MSRIQAPTTRVALVLAALASGLTNARAQGANGGGTDPAPTSQPAPPPASAQAGSDGFTIQSESGDYRLRVGGYVQGDGRFYAGDSQGLGSDTFLLRRARPLLRGTLAQRFDFNLMTDFGGGSATVQDAYLDVRFASFLRLRVGKFKPPVGLERLQSGSNMLFVERALPTAIVPNRDVGLQLHGDVGSSLVVWALAVQNGVADGGSSDGDTNDGKDVSGRVFLQPFRNTPGPLQGLGLGVAGQVGRQDAATPASYRSPGQLVFFGYASGVVASGTRKRLSPQGWLYAGPFGLLAEYAVSTTPLRKDAAAGRIRNEAWQAAVSLFLTGEKAAFQAVKPKHAFDPGKRAWGALELAARVHRLSIDPAAFSLGFADPAKSARRATAWAIGLNWHLSRNVKYVLDYEQTSFEGGATTGDRPTERALLARAQVLF